MHKQELTKPMKQTNQRTRGRRMIAPVKDAIVTRFCFSPAKPEVDQLRRDFEIPAFGVTSVLLENLFKRVTDLERVAPSVVQASTMRPYLIVPQRKAA